MSGTFWQPLAYVLLTLLLTVGLLVFDWPKKLTFASIDESSVRVFHQADNLTQSDWTAT
jgi:hypothetical protein